MTLAELSVVLVKQVVRTTLIEEFEDELAEPDDCLDRRNGLNHAACQVERYDMTGRVNEPCHIGGFQNTSAIVSYSPQTEIVALSSDGAVGLAASATRA